MRDETSRLFLDGGGRLGELIRSHDWAGTPFGATEAWPQSLRSALSICLHSSFPTAIYWGPDLRLLYNDAWSPIPGDRHPAALGRPAAEVWSDIWDVIGPQIERVLETGEGFSTYDQMLPMVRGGAPQETYWNYSFTPIRGEDGRVAGVFNQGNETTDIVLARRKAEADIERFAYLFDQTPGAIAILRGPRHTFEIANAAYETLVGRSDLVGRPLVEGLPELVGQGFVAMCDDVYRTGRPQSGRAVPVELERTDGREVRHVDFILQPVNDGAGSRYGIFVQATDVTDTIRAEEALRVSEARYEAIVNSIDQMIWSTRPDGFHDYYNDRWYEYTGVPEGSTDGEEWNGMFHPEDRVRARARWQHSLDTGEPYHIEYRLRHNTGEYRWVIGRAQCVRGPDGEIARWFGTCTDIHDLKMAEESRVLVLQELNHRIKNLFSIVSGMVSMTARSASSAAEMGETLKGRLAALGKAHDLIRIGSSSQEVQRAAPLRPLVDEVLRPHLLPQEPGRVTLTGPDLTVGDRASTGIALILHELATNAAKYGALKLPGGRLAVDWTIDRDRFDLSWTETVPGTALHPPTSLGFGSRLVRSTVEGQLMGTMDVDWTGSGVSVAISADMAQLVH
ncbi:PAS domain-containing sensor histidine kinase [Wenxinia marina]|uniref:histidine kinase n=1 Tax=Wenxinia marina DSM 24838 TaxID=1123501 RepID=A0A0D0PI95_9RHOB|nr:PAS domain-containing protein [Wenxinia marina]KIQ71106.1 PAS domain S-box [Wenxinia marina DSM 24838]GGL54789.1 hypothetical protein GCM10011392_06500 [Wenxinia marina]